MKVSLPPPPFFKKDGLGKLSSKNIIKKILETALGSSGDFVGNQFGILPKTELLLLMMVLI